MYLDTTYMRSMAGCCRLQLFSAGEFFSQLRHGEHILFRSVELKTVSFVRLGAPELWFLENMRKRVENLRPNQKPLRKSTFVSAFHRFSPPPKKEVTDEFTAMLASVTL
jgi:hypothetical protein